MGGGEDFELLEQTPRLLEIGEKDEVGQERTLPSRSYRGRLVAAACAAGGLALLGRHAYSGQGMKKTRKETTGIMMKDVARGLPRASCTDNDFKDAYGDSCSDWYISENRCKQAHKYTNTAGKDATTECCQCGGGTRGGGGGDGANECTDFKNWKDKDGDTCQMYEDNDWCGIASDWANSAGVDATSACCFCGGGSKDGGGGDTTAPPSGGSGQCGVKGGASRRLMAAKGITAKIVNGQVAESCEWKWQIGLRHRGSSAPYCGAQLISEEWVLTAAHCVEDGSTNFELVAGKFETRSDNDNVQTSLVKKVIMHPSYSSDTMNFDVALIKLRSPFTLNDCVGTICLPEQGSDIHPGAKCWISGWGTTSSGGSQPSKLQEAEVEIHPQHDCAKSNGHGSILPSMICAQGRSPDGKVTDGCQGDSGGPLVCEVQGKWILFGATSWGFGCADAAKPGVWARVHEALDWIAETRAAN